MDLDVLGLLMLGSGGDDEEGSDGGEDRGEAGASIWESSRPSTPAPRGGLIKQMEESAKMGFGGWFNREDQSGLPESWSGPNSEVLASQDQVGMTLLTTIGGRTLPNPVRVPDNITHPAILTSLMEGPI